MSPQRLMRTGTLVAAGLALSACGSVTPGAAATVDGDTISMKTLDDAARIYCEVTAVSAAQQGIRAIDNAELRRQAVTDLVLTRLADDIVEERGLRVPATPDVDPARLQEAFGSRAPEVAETIQDSQQLFSTFAAIGADDAGTTVTDATSDALAEAGRAAVLQTFPDNDVEFAPRLGLSDDGQPDGDIGSLSVAPVDLEAPTPEELPAALSCRA